MIEHQTVTEDEDHSPVPENLPLRLHPRVFAALGKDLVTNDVVAVLELVKNAYDAFAENVWIEFGTDQDEGACLEIRDDGMGMSREMIENVWCLVATPHRQRNPFVTKGNKQRRVVGAKGLGRLSVARLGNRLEMLTKSREGPCWQVQVDWSELAKNDSLEQSTVTISEYSERAPFENAGTSLKITELQGNWQRAQIEDLRENLARLLSPFSETNDFNIFFSVDEKSDSVRIETPEFLSKPKYSIHGIVDDRGAVEAEYRFSPISTNQEGRTRTLGQSWYNIRESIPNSDRTRFSEGAPSCGPFWFEIRAWDIGANDTREISERFAVQRSVIRRAIRAHKGISVYRDSFLVLPKSDNARDWLGLDLRRVGRVGPRLSTSQLVGYVSITADENPGIEDTSDREGLSASLAVEEFETILRAIVRLLESERNNDRARPGREQPMDDLFNRLSAEDLMSNVAILAHEGATAADVLPVVQTFHESLGETRETIRERFVYYSRLATVGTIAQMIIHEIRNRATAIGRAIRLMEQFVEVINHRRATAIIGRARNSLETLERLADTFAPLANRRHMRRNDHIVIEEAIKECLELCQPDIRSKEIVCHVPETEHVVVADPGELDTILLNLINNATFWLGEVPQEQRTIEFALEANATAKTPRLNISIHDSGPGIDPEDLENIFLPGVTRRPDGIGMGLNVASELVSIYGGEMRTMRHPTKLGGASFRFDLPLVASASEDRS